MHEASRAARVLRLICKRLSRAEGWKGRQICVPYPRVRNQLVDCAKRGLETDVSLGVCCRQLHSAHRGAEVHDPLEPGRT